MSPEVISKAVRAYFAAIRAMNQQAWVDTFAEDAITHDPVGTPFIEGHQKLGEFFQAITAYPLNHAKTDPRNHTKNDNEKRQMRNVK